jgi:membrane protein YqaA with SNARE-associated domain
MAGAHLSAGLRSSPFIYSLIPFGSGKTNSHPTESRVHGRGRATGDARRATYNGLSEWTFGRAEREPLLKQFFAHLMAKWKLVFLPAILKLGAVGAGAVAVLDSSTIPVPMDFFIAGWVWKDQHRFWIYCIMAALGSAIGGLLPYVLGRAGGELFLLKRVNRERYDRLRIRFEKQEFLAMAIPSMLPPPTPWKLFVFAAGVFEMPIAPFMLAVFTGRFVRWMLLSLLVLKLGPGAVGIVQHHALTALIVVLGLALIGFGWWWVRKRRSGELGPESSD